MGRGINMGRGISMGRKVLGLEVTGNSIKMALVKNGKRPELLSCGVIPSVNKFNNGIISDDESDLKSIAQIIREIVSNNEEMSKGVDSLALCLNNTQTVVRPISLPVIPAKELNAAVEYELSQSFPGVAKTHTISFKEYTRTKNGINGIVAFAPLKALEGYRRLIDTLNFKHSYLDVIANSETKAFAAFADAPKDDRVYFLCDIGSNDSMFTIVQNNMIKHSRQVPDGNKALKEIFCDKLGVSAKEYEQFCNRGLDEAEISDADLESVASVVYANIGKQLVQMIEFYNTGASTQSVVAEVYLIGGGGLFPKLDQYFASVLGIPVKMIQPNKTLTTDPLIFSRAFSAIGAAVREDE